MAGSEFPLSRVPVCRTLCRGSRLKSGLSHAREFRADAPTTAPIAQVHRCLANGPPRYAPAPPGCRRTHGPMEACRRLWSNHPGQSTRSRCPWPHGPGAHPVASHRQLRDAGKPCPHAHGQDDRSPKSATAFNATTRAATSHAEPEPTGSPQVRLERSGDCGRRVGIAVTCYETVIQSDGMSRSPSRQLWRTAT